MLYPQNGDRIVAVDFVTSLHPMYKDREHYSSLRRRKLHCSDAKRRSFAGMVNTGIGTADDRSSVHR